MNLILMNLIYMLIRIYIILGLTGAFALILLKNNESRRKKCIGIFKIVFIMITFFILLIVFVMIIFGLIISYISI